MGKSYKFKGEVNYSFNKKKKPTQAKPRVDQKIKEEKLKQDLEGQGYSEWEDEGDYEKFNKGRR